MGTDESLKPALPPGGDICGSRKDFLGKWQWGEHFWVQLLTVEFIFSILVILGGLRSAVSKSSPSSLITSCLKTSRRCLMSWKQGQGKMSRCLVDDVFCKDDTNLSANTLYSPNCKTWEITTQTWNRAFAFKLKVTPSHWNQHNRERFELSAVPLGFVQFGNRGSFRKQPDGAAESLPSSVCLVSFPFFQDREMVGVMAIADSLLSL